MKRLNSTPTWWRCYALRVYARSKPHQPAGRPAINSIGIDLHKRESQLCFITEDAELVERRNDAQAERRAAEVRWNKMVNEDPEARRRAGARPVQDVGCESRIRVRLR